MKDHCYTPSAPCYMAPFILILLIWFSASGFALADNFVVSVRSKEITVDSRENYNSDLIKLALDKTIVHYGSYKLQEIPPSNRPRAQYLMTSNAYPNMLLEMSYEKRYTEKSELIAISFPVDLGIISHRICFVNPLVKEAIAQINHVEQLKAYSILQGVGWTDSAILRANGFRVTESSNYESMFKMVTAGRADLFCRSISELPKEVKEFHYISGLSYDESFVLTYHMPRFFYTNSRNTLLKARMEEGLKLAWKDGSLKQLWLSHFSRSIEQAQLPKRKVFTINNPFLEELNPDYQAYLMDFQTLK